MAAATPPALFGRVITAMVTPFDDRLQIDEKQVARLVDHLIETGSGGLVVCGTTGETATLSHDEKIELFALVKKFSGGRAKVIAGAGTNNTADSIQLARQAEEIGVDGLLLITPYYNRPSQEGLYQHFCAIAKETKLPIMMYNVPARTSVNMTAATAVRCANDCANIVALKEASSDLAQIAEIASAAPSGFQIYSGEDGVNLPILSVGGVGTVSVTSHVAGRALAQMHEAYFAGDYATARDLHLKTLPLTRALFCTASPAPTKYALKKLGVLDNDKLRLPLVSVNADERAIVDDALAAFGPV
jgi:4-hydroxy-tetrahydrodipicolinate synthase